MVAEIKYLHVIKHSPTVEDKIAWNSMEQQKKTKSRMCLRVYYTPCTGSDRSCVREKREK